MVTTSKGQDHVTKWRSAVIKEEDPLHVERHKLSVVHLIEAARRETTKISPKHSGVWCSKRVIEHSHHSIWVVQEAQSGPEGQQRDQNQNQVHLSCHHQGKRQHYGHLHR